MQFTLSILALVLSLAFHGSVHGPSIDVEIFGHDSLSAHPHLNVNQAQAETNKGSKKLTFFALTEFNYLSSISTLRTSLQNFVYYLPLYSLIRKKQYFLLI